MASRLSLEDRVARIEATLEKLNHEVGQLVGEQRSVSQLIKYVILPLIVIVGGLVGVKIIFP